jgi:serine protease Do
MVHISRIEVGMNAAFSSLLLAAIMLLSIVSPADAQERTQAKGISLADVDSSIEALVRAVNPSVVQVFVSGLAPLSGVVTDQSDLVTPQRGTGSGVIVQADGYIVTNAHVVRGASRIRVEIPTRTEGQSLLARRSRVAPARIIGVDEETDIAVLRVEERGLPALPFGDSDELRTGQLVLAFGSPLGLQNSVSLGIVSAAARQLEPESPMVYIQTDAAINSGNSGGPLVDARGRLMGINSLLLSGGAAAAGPGFAAPSNIVRTVFEQIRKTGRVRRGEIGVRAQTVTPTLAAGLGLKRDQGVVLADVAPGSPADKAGLSVGDLVLTLDGKPMENGRQLHVNLYRREVGETVRLEVLRGDRPTTVTVPVAERADPLSAATLLSDPRENVVARLGILAATLDPKLAAMLPLRGRAGVVVASASATVLDSDNGGLAPGDVIHAANGQWISDLAALRGVVDSTKPGAPLVLQIERRGVLMYLAFTLE